MTFNFKIFALLLIFAFNSFADAQQKTVENKDLPNFFAVNQQLMRGAQPSEAGIKQLAARGVKTIIDLRGADERARREEKWARAANIEFVNAPLNNWFAPKDRQIETILNIINDPAKQPVFVHCKRGADRTGTVIAAFRISHDNWTAEAARDEAKNFSFGWWQFWMRDFINDYYRDFHKANQPAKNE